jgi:hypothetical protein
MLDFRVSRVRLLQQAPIFRLESLASTAFNTCRPSVPFACFWVCKPMANCTTMAVTLLNLLSPPCTADCCRRAAAKRGSHHGHHDWSHGIRHVRIPKLAPAPHRPPQVSSGEDKAAGGWQQWRRRRAAGSSGGGGSGDAPGSMGVVAEDRRARGGGSGDCVNGGGGSAEAGAVRRLLKGGA